MPTYDHTSGIIVADNKFRGQEYTVIISNGVQRWAYVNDRLQRLITRFIAFVTKPPRLPPMILWFIRRQIEPFIFNDKSYRYLIYFKYIRPILIPLQRIKSQPFPILIPFLRIQVLSLRVLLHPKFFKNSIEGNII